MIAAHVYVGPDARIRLYSPVVGEWLLVDWAWFMASMNTARRWYVHTDASNASRAAEALHDVHR